MVELGYTNRVSGPRFVATVTTPLPPFRDLLARWRAATAVAKQRSEELRAFHDPLWALPDHECVRLRPEDRARTGALYATTYSAFRDGGHRGVQIGSKTLVVESLRDAVAATANGELAEAVRRAWGASQAAWEFAGGLHRVVSDVIDETLRRIAESDPERSPRDRWDSYRPPVLQLAGVSWVFGSSLWHPVKPRDLDEDAVDALARQRFEQESAERDYRRLVMKSILATRGLLAHDGDDDELGDE